MDDDVTAVRPVANGAGSSPPEHPVNPLVTTAVAERISGGDIEQLDPLDVDDAQVRTKLRVYTILAALYVCIYMHQIIPSQATLR